MSSPWQRSRWGWGASGHLPHKLSVAVRPKCHVPREHQVTAPEPAGRLPTHPTSSLDCSPHPRGQTSSGPQCSQWSVTPPSPGLCWGEGRTGATQDDITSERSFKNTVGGLPWWHSGYKSACQCRGHGFEPGSGKIPRAAEQLGPCATTTEPAL